MLQSLSNEKPMTIGILGGGQLAKMIALEAYRMGLNIAIIENSKDSPAGDMTKLDFDKGWFDKDELDLFINSCDIVTLENEFIPLEILEYIEKTTTVFPSSKTMGLVQDKYVQKETFQNFGIKVPNFAKINEINDGINFAEKYGYPFVLKTRRLGYDGYGNATINNIKDLELYNNKFKSKNNNTELMAEEFVNFKKELAVMVARNVSGEVEIYPTVETIQKNHICHKVISPAPIDKELLTNAQEIALKCVESIDGVGVFGVELFLTNDDDILVNEIAPRPHNSGHYTIEACYTSQFENCFRAILDLPLGSSKMIKNAAVMINLLGEKNGMGVPNNVKKLLEHKEIFLHLYNKKQSRVGRKMGHITTIADSYEEAMNLAEKAYNDLIW